MNKHGDIDQRAWELLNARLDGELSPAEQQELDALLEESGEARELSGELGAVTRLMDALPELDPPQHLQKTIERQIRLPLQDKGPGEKRGMFGNWLSANWLRTGLALAAGVVLTVGVYEMGSEPISERDSGHLVGTVVKPGQGVVLDRLKVSNESLNGELELRKSGDIFALDVQLDADSPARLVLDFAGQGFEFEGIEQLLDDDDNVSVTDGVISVTGVNEQRYILNLRRLPETDGHVPKTLKLAFFADGSPIMETELEVLHR